MTSSPVITTSEGEDFSAQIADSVESFLLAVRAIAASGDGGSAIPLLLLEVSQVLLTGARLGAQSDFEPREEYQPDVGEEADVDELRMGLAEILDSVDTYSFVFDPYEPEILVSQISDDVASVVTDLENGLRHYRLGNVDEALWWWQFSYVNNWGNLAGAVLNALLMVIAHDRLDAEPFTGEDEDLAAADEMLGDAAR
ncbi:DUF5063 domain-containing protein [Nocardioides nematodiphilus]|uniref:DUF5063 domain-containing protein n=1 Tax=Nocardioides nematodiphilus TaxID=2849669 RepID=UPI001CD92975|nr:DUF5063 domain-containing protein [Nocardioides nematodiphilus]MCA1981734.1 DUF5063 domain-containing protein [Nocardioides nematodiphilus]